MRSHTARPTLSAALAIVLVVALAVGASFAMDTMKKGPTSVDRSQDFERIKKLTGEWTMDGGDGSVAVTYRITAGGSAVVETLFPGSPHEMITVYHMDGSNLMMTHYCSAGNQPRMKAAPGGAANQVIFKFSGATGLKSPKDEHMHEAAITFLDDNHIHADWTAFAGGKKKDVKAFNFTRKQI